MAVATKLTTTFPLVIAGYTFPGYTAVYTVILNLAVAAVLTPLFNALGPSPAPPTRPWRRTTTPDPTVRRGQGPRPCHQTVTNALDNPQSSSDTLMHEQRGVRRQMERDSMSITKRLMVAGFGLLLGMAAVAAADISGAGATFPTRSMRNGRMPTRSSPASASTTSRSARAAASSRSRPRP